MRARHRVGKLLLRHDLRFDGNNWTQAHRDWLKTIAPEVPVRFISAGDPYWKPL